MSLWPSGPLPTFRTMNAPRRIGFLAFDGVQALDLVGPADAFGSDAFDAASSLDGGRLGQPYETVVIGLTGRCFTSSSALPMRAHVDSTARIKLDTLIVPGGAGLRKNGVDRKAAAWITAHAPSIRRIASVCTGLYGLAPTGLLDGCRVTTHWSAAQDIARRFPKLDVQADAVFLKCGKFYTSAGITAGIDLALALIEEDHGPNVALSVAREMVVYVKRSGGQNQFSEPLQFQMQSSDRFRDLAAWISSHLRTDLSVEALADRTFLSVRHFSRAFKEEFGTTPAEFVENARMSEAQRRLSESRRRISIANIARSVGYSSDDVFRRAFERHFGIAPATYQSRFGSGSNSR
jgi:transcriptional regulator GlxA family with amidase domain